jgi:hypothetical protein
MHTFRLAAVMLLLAPVIRADAPPPKNKLAEESAAEWRPLFDGKNLDGWEIDGDFEIVDGVLILGGERETRAYLPLQHFRDFTIRFQYQLDGKTSAGYGWSSLGEPRKPTPGLMIPDLLPAKKWHESTIEEYWDIRHFQQRFIKGQHGANGVFRPIQSFWIETPAGVKIRLRNIRVRQAADDSWAWIMGLPVLFAGLVGLAPNGLSASCD